MVMVADAFSAFFCKKMILVHRVIVVNRLFNKRKWNKTESEQFYFLGLYNNQVNALPLIGPSAMVYCASKL